jgi:hypothetical protein
MDFTNEELKSLFDRTISALTSEAETSEELIRIWINIGMKLGIEYYFPHLKVIVHSEEEGQRREILALIGSASEEVVEYLSSEETMNDEVVEKILGDIEKRKGEVH